MGVSQPSISSCLDSKDIVLESKGMCGSSCGSICNNFKVVFELRAVRRQLKRRQRIKRNYGALGWNKRPKILMKRRDLLEGPGMPTNGVERRVRTLQKLLPNRKSMELDVLFREAADYILGLEMQVKVMQLLVKALSNSDI